MSKKGAYNEIVGGKIRAIPKNRGWAHGRGVCRDAGAGFPRLHYGDLDVWPEDELQLWTFQPGNSVFIQRG